MSPRKFRFTLGNSRFTNLIIVFFILISFFGTTSSTTKSPDRYVFPVPFGVTASTNLSQKIHIEWYAQCGDAYSDHFNIYAKEEGESSGILIGEVPYDSCALGVPFEYDFYMNGITDFAYRDYTITIKTVPEDGIGGSSDKSTPVVGSAIISPPYISATDGTYDTKIEVSFFEFKDFNSQSYKVFRSSTINGTYTLVGTTYDDINLDGTFIDYVSPGAQYFYKGQICTKYGDCSDLSTTPAYGYASVTGPSGISATDGTEDQYISITWNDTGATSYRLYRSLTEPAPADPADYYVEVYGNQYQDYGADPYTTYFYWVRSYDSDIMGWTEPSSPDTGWRPFEPANTVSASDGTSTSSIDVTWGHDDEEVTTYIIYRSETSDGTKTTIGSSHTKSFSDTMAISGKTYYYYVESCDGENHCSALTGNGSYNDGYRAMTDTTGIDASDGTSTSEVSITWDPVFGATSYNIYRGTDTNVLLASNIGTSASESFSDTTATPGITYNYWIKGCSEEICNALSTWNSGWRSMPIPANVQASDGTSIENVSVSWEPVSEAVDYEVYRAVSSSASPVLWSVFITDTTFNDPVATPGVTYYYWVKACNSYICSELSDYDTGWQDLGIPTNLQATDGTEYLYIEVSWSGVANSTYYEVFYGDSALDTPILLSNNAGMPYQDSDAEPGENRGYWVRACNDYICGGFSEFEPGSRGIYDISGIQATDGDYDKVTVTWTHIEDSVTYRVFRSETLDGTKTLLDSVTGMTFYEDTSASPGTIYFYWVNQCGPDVCSSFTEYDTGWRRGGALPTVSSITRLDANPTNAAYVDFLVTFNKDVTGVDITDFVLTGTVGTPSVMNVSGSGNTRTVNVYTGTGSGTLRLDIVDDNSIQDDITNELGGGLVGDGDFNTGEAYTVDKESPSLDEFTAHMPSNPTNADVLAFRVVFSESVNNVDVSDFVLDSTTTATITDVDPMPAGVFYVHVSGGDLADFNGFVGLNLSSQQDITDPAGNPLPQSEPPIDESFEVINTAPTLSIERLTPPEELVSVDQVTFILTFSKGVTNVDETDFVVSGGSTASITAFSEYSRNLSSTFMATVSGGDLATFNGKLGLDLNPSQDITDSVGNALPQEEPEIDETYTIDHVNPEVSLAANGEPGSVITFITRPDQITINFNEAITHDGGDNSADNPDNYLLFTAGANGGYDTASCAEQIAGNTGDDVFLPVGPAVYEDNEGTGPFIVTLTVNNGYPLPLGEYKLFVCGTTSITDLSGNELNGGESDAYVILNVINPELPETGFTPSTITPIPAQPDKYDYDDSFGLWLNIPKIDVLAPIIGVPAVDNEWDLTWLGNDVGYLEGTAFPTWSGNTALTAHVYTSEGYPGLFNKLGTLGWGDKVRIYAAGTEYVYEVRYVDLYIDPENLSSINQHEDYDWVTLITCSGYDTESGQFLWRTVVRAVLVEINFAD